MCPPILVPIGAALTGSAAGAAGTALAASQAALGASAFMGVASTRKAREARATARVSAGEAGVAGLSVDALINSLTQEEAQYRFSETQNQQMTDVGRDLQLRDAGIGSEMNLLRINRPIEQPNYLGSILSGAQTGLSTYTAMRPRP